jgi:hypothetical protein
VLSRASSSDQLHGLSLERAADVLPSLADQPMPVHEGAAPALLTHVAFARRHVNALELGWADAVHGPHGPSPGLLSARHQCVEPACRHQHVVVDENDVLRPHRASGQISGLVRRQIVVGSDQLESLLPALGLEVFANVTGRATVDIDERERRHSGSVHALQRRACLTESLTGHHNHRHQSFRHRSPPRLSRFVSRSPIRKDNNRTRAAGSG